MDSKRDLDGEKRLIRNEKARRRRALQYACRYLPIELEKKIFNYMKNPNNGRIDVSMKWQKHPVAPLSTLLDKMSPDQIKEALSFSTSFSPDGRPIIRTNVVKPREIPRNTHRFVLDDKGNRIYIG